MNVSEAFDSLKQHFEAFVESGKEKLEHELPVLADLVQKAASNPVIAAIAQAEHLDDAPEWLEALATEITKVDNALGTAKAAGAAQAQADAAAAAQAAAEAQVPADAEEHGAE